MAKKSKLGLGLAIGAAVGAAAGFLVSDQPGKKLRSNLKNEYDRYLKMIEEHNMESVAADIFGRATSTGRKQLTIAKRELAHGVAELRERSKRVTTEKYKTLIKNVVAGIKENQEVSADSISKLTAYLESDLKKLTRKAPVKETAKSE